MRTSIEPTPRLLAPARGIPAPFADRSGGRRKWWLWPHLLSLDAPLVAVVWQDWWGRCVGEAPAPAQRIILGLGVWLIYLADRLADNARDFPESGATTARHDFARTHRRPLLGLSGVVAGTLMVLAPLALSTSQFHRGLVLLAAAGVYFLAIHRRTQPRWTRHVSKEAVVGGMFALGSAFFECCRPGPTPLLLALAVALFGVVCFLNCALITTWERTPLDRRDPASLLNAFPALVNGGLHAMCWGVAAASAVGWGWHGAAFAPLTMAAAALALLDGWRGRCSADALRCLVDLVLLSPGVCLGMAAAFRWAGPYLS